MNMFLSKKEVFEKDSIIDVEGFWHFPNGRELLEKGKRLVKKSNYKIYDYNEEREIGLDELENKVKWSRGGGSCMFRSYGEVREYVDRKNKVYYIYLGKKNSYDMWC